MLNENPISFGKNALFDVPLDSLMPDNLDDNFIKDKEYYVKVNCKNKDEVREIIKIIEKIGIIEKKRIVISA